MKKAIILLCLVAGILSCTKEPVGLQAPAADTPMTFEISVAETKAAKDAWADGDKIYVFFKNLATKYLVMTYSTGTGWDNASGDPSNALTSGDFSSLGTKTLTAVHFPVAVDVTYDNGKFSFTSGGNPVYNYYLFEEGKDYTVDGTTVTATLALSKPANMVQIHVAGIQGSLSAYTFGCSKIKPVACASVGTDGAITESVLQAGARLSAVADSDGGIFAGRLTTTESADYKFTLASDTQIYTLTRTAKTLSAGKMYNFPALSETGGDNWAVTDVSDLYVDLGLSVKWAKCNLGAANPEDYGDYFAWGELQPKNDYQWSMYLYGSNYDQLTKYCGNPDRGKDGYKDALTTLLPEDDAAYAAFGGHFRMPTTDEVYELCILDYSHPGEYTITWCDGTPGYQYNGTSAKGLMIVRNSTGATLFLPMAGNYTGTTLYNVGTYGRFYSSSIYANGYYNKATTLRLRWDSTERSIARMDLQRTDGASIRPVFK